MIKTLLLVAVFTNKKVRAGLTAAVVIRVAFFVAASACLDRLLLKRKRLLFYCIFAAILKLKIFTFFLGFF